jgi:hypothetical protein
MKRGALPALVATAIEDGLTWWQRATHQVEALVEDAHDTLTGSRRHRG